MNIEFQSVSKRFAYEWIFRDVNYAIPSGSRLGIIGPNGSGKSTFLRVLLGTIDPSKGKVLYQAGDKVINANEVFQNFSFTAPYMGIPDNLTIEEAVKFHFKFRNVRDDINPNDIPEIALLANNKKKLIRQYSSGMRQRFKLILAMATDSKILVFDEPTTNLDEEGKTWFQSNLKKYLGARTLIIATNEKDDLALVSEKLNIIDYKKKS
ncbi:ABC transporter ATP-binding protein [Saprospiraceae bacterium]|nr:ABC transporter ATP-binding protein [Saprospiraceae bacterium]